MQHYYPSKSNDIHYYCLFTVTHLTTSDILCNSEVFGPPVHVRHVEPKVVCFGIFIEIDIGKRQQVVASESSKACHDA